MSVTEVGGDFVTNEAFDITRSKIGLWTGVQTYYIRKAELITLLPAIGSVHPSFSWMTMEDARCSGEAGEWVKVDASYAGMNPVDELEDPDVINPPQYTLTTTVSEEQIEVHPRYADALTEDQIQLASKLAKDPPVDENKEPVAVDQTGWAVLQIELYDFIRRGVEVYRDPKVTWSKSWVSDERPADLNDVGKIDTPDGSPPTVAAGRNWMNMGLNSVETAGVFENEITWELSGRGGYLTELYS